MERKVKWTNFAPILIYKLEYLLSMKKSTLFLSSIFVLASTAAAQSLCVKEMLVNPEQRQPHFSVRVIGKEANTAMHRANANFADYGTEVSILTQNFDGMTTGSISNPDKDTELLLDEYEYPWWNMNPNYLGGQEHWGGSNIYSAGGCVCLDAQGEGAHLSTPLLDCSGYDRIAVLRFKARVRKSGQATQVLLEAAETNNMSPSWNDCGYMVCPAITNQWQTYEAVFYNCGPTTLFNIVSYDNLSIFIDDLEVYQIDQYVHTPIVLPYSNYTGTSFQANWEAVDGAESYLLDVYSYDVNTGEVAEFLKQQPAVGTSYVVEGITSGATYYYEVSAVKGEHVSMSSTSSLVFDLEAPKNLRAVIDNNNGSYTASWDEVPSADVYNYLAYYNHKATQDGEFVVTNTDFTGVVDADGNETGWTVDFYSYSTYASYYLPAREMGGQAGWYGTAYAPYTDYICLDAWQYYYNHEDAALHSPELDFSKDDGRITVTLDAFGVFSEYEAEDGEWVNYHTVPAIAIFNWNDELQDYEQAELVYGETVEDEWTPNTFTLTKGSKRTVLGVYALGNSENLYVDNLRITQQYAAGESLIDPFEIRHYYEGTQTEISVPVRASGAELSHQVSAVKSVSGIGLKESETTHAAIEGTVQGINAPKLDLSQAACVDVSNGSLSIQNPALAPVSVYGADGKLLFRGNGMTIVTPVLNADFVVVKVGAQSIKVAL